MNEEKILSRKLTTLFQDDLVRAEAVALLEAYGTESYEQEPPRVRLAILKLTGPDLSQIKKYTDMARQDYRDILAWAEYPRQSKKWSVPDGPKKKKIMDEDRAEYEAWLNI